tara:strand:- start:255 stop:428 length:174 start_codon:yes stop_codon:yes gene_type:complete
MMMEWMITEYDELHEWLLDCPVKWDLIEDKESKGRRIVQARFYAIDYDPNEGYNHST